MAAWISGKMNFQVTDPSCKVGAKGWMDIFRRVSWKSRTLNGGGWRMKNMRMALSRQKATRFARKYAVMFERRDFQTRVFPWLRRSEWFWMCIKIHVCRINNARLLALHTCFSVCTFFNFEFLKAIFNLIWERFLRVQLTKHVSVLRYLTKYR